MKNFRIYANKQGWELVTIKRTMKETNQVIRILEDNKVSSILVVEHDTELNKDEIVYQKIKR